MSYFNSNITGGSGGSGVASGLVTKLVKTITISSSELAEVKIDISRDISNYKDVTNDRIIVELNDVSAIAAGDAELTHTYDAETGMITITSTNSSIPFASSSSVELSANVYVAGAVQLPPEPEIKLGKFAYLENVASNGSGFTITFNNTDKKIKRIILNGYLAFTNIMTGYLPDGNTSTLFQANSNSGQTFPKSFDVTSYNKIAIAANSYDDNWKNYIGNNFDLSKINVEY